MLAIHDKVSCKYNPHFVNVNSLKQATNGGCKQYKFLINAVKKSTGVFLFSGPLSSLKHKNLLYQITKLVIHGLLMIITTGINISSRFQIAYLTLHPSLSWVHDVAYIIVAIETLSQTCPWIYAHSCSCGYMVFILLGQNVEVLMFSCVKDEFLWLLTKFLLTIIIKAISIMELI